MRKYAFSAIGIAAVLLTGTAPGGDGCGLVLSADHTCCAPSATEASSECCADSDGPDHSPAPEHRDRCDCIHPVSSQAALFVSSSPPAPEEPLSTAPKHDAPSSDALPDNSVRTAPQVRNHAPPPVFLLDCAFLI